MNIRNSVKAVIINNDKILLNRCVNKDEEYYAFPGGGQNKYESMEEAVIRECLEETGYDVLPVKFLTFYETIYTDEEIRKNDSDHAHKVYFFFLCNIKEESGVSTPKEQDENQIGFEWIDIKQIKNINLYPLKIAENIEDILNGKNFVFLGSDRIQ